MRKFIFLAAVIVFLILSAGDASACTCLMDMKTPVGKQIKTAYQKAAAVFYGEVTEITRESQGVIVKIKVEKSWKGQLESEAVVGTLADSGMCGYSFEKGKKYMVYADGNSDRLDVGLCSRTNPSDTDARYLNKIKKPVLLTKGQQEKINK
jgi:hypothetical protein